MAKASKIELGRDGFSVPLDAITNTFCIFGVRGSGKSNCATVFAEAIVKAGQPICIIDPTGSWWGMKSAKDGKREGLPVYILGGEHGDAPLEFKAGSVVAEFLVKERVPVILDLKLLRKHEQVYFVMEFAEAIYHANREPLMVVIDECSRFAPQTLPASQPALARCLGAITDIVTLGRTRGLGAITLAQRPSQINTSLRSQAENLICLRTIGKHDRKALDEWVEAKGTIEQRNVMMADLASLPNGTGYFWSPSWLDEFRKVSFLHRETFDSGRTPKIGEKVTEPRALAAIDKARLSEEILAAAARVKADDPKELRKKIAELEKALKASPLQAQTSSSTAMEAALEKQRRSLDLFLATRSKWLAGITAKISRHLDGIAELVGTLGSEGKDLPVASLPATVPVVVAAAAAPVRALAQRQVLKAASGNEASLSKAERSLLAVLAQFPSGRSKIQLSILSGYSIKSGSFANALGALRSKGLAAGSDPLTITADGREAARDIEAVPTDSDSLRRHWMGVLGKAEKTMFAVLCEKHSLTKEQLASLSGYSLTSSSFANAIGRLRSLQLATSTSPGVIDLSEELR